MGCSKLKPHSLAALLREGESCVSSESLSVSASVCGCVCAPVPPSTSPAALQAPPTTAACCHCCLLPIRQLVASSATWFSPTRAPTLIALLCGKRLHPRLPSLRCCERGLLSAQPTPTRAPPTTSSLPQYTPHPISAPPVQAHPAPPPSPDRRASVATPPYSSPLAASPACWPTLQACTSQSHRFQSPHHHRSSTYTCSVGALRTSDESTGHRAHAGRAWSRCVSISNLPQPCHMPNARVMSTSATYV